MKKFIACMLVFVLAMSMVACGAKDGSAAAAPLEGTMEENVTKIMEKVPVEFMGGLIPIDLTDTSEDGMWMIQSFTGLDSAEKITDVAAFEPMTGSQAFSLVMVRVADAAEAKAVAEQMKENIDPRKWICVGADEVMAAGYSDTVLFIMLDSTLGLEAQSYVDAFAEICGGELDFTI